MSASPTSCAFISRATARARGLRDGDVVVAAIVGARSAKNGDGGASSGASKLDAPKTKTPSATVRIVALPGGAAAPGHVALPPATRERLGVTQGDRVAAVRLDSARRPREEGEGQTLVRLRPVASSRGEGTDTATASGTAHSDPRRDDRSAIGDEGGGGGSGVGSGSAAAGDAVSESADPGGVSARSTMALEPAHLAALGLSRSDCACLGGERDRDGDRFDAAARGLLARWVATQSRFRAPPDSNADANGDGSRPGEASAAAVDVPAVALVVPAATGSTIDVRVVGVDGATTAARFELDVRAPGGVAALTPELFGLAPDGAPLARDASDVGTPSDEVGTPSDDSRAPRVELSSTVSTAASVPRPSPASKLFGRAVTVDPFLGADASLDAVAPPGSSAAAVAADATARLIRALRGYPRDDSSSRTRTGSRTGSRTVASPRPPRPGGALLWGASGSGKSAAARAIARRLRDDPATLACVVSVDCGTLPRGDSRAAAAAFRAAATAASRRAPAVVVLDDVDAVAPADASDAGAGAPSPGTTVGEILSDLMDATSARGAPRVVWLATAASPESLAPATRFAGRLDFDGEIRAPEREGGREALVAAVADARGTPVAPGAARAAAKSAEGFAAGDLRAFVERAAHAAAAARLRNRRADGDAAARASERDSGRTSERDAASLAAVVAAPERSKRDQETETETYSGVADVFASGVSEEGVSRVSASLRARDFAEARSGLTSSATRALGARARGGVDGHPSPGPSSSSSPLDAVGGLADVKTALDEALSLPSRHASVFAEAPLRLAHGRASVRSPRVRQDAGGARRRRRRGFTVRLRERPRVAQQIHRTERGWRSRRVPPRRRRRAVRALLRRVRRHRAATRTRFHRRHRSRRQPISHRTRRRGGTRGRHRPRRHVQARSHRSRVVTPRSTRSIPPVSVSEPTRTTRRTPTSPPGFRRAPRATRARERRASTTSPRAPRGSRARICAP